MKSLTTFLGGLVNILFMKPIRERGVLWTFLAWTLVLNSLAFFSQLTRAGLVWTFLVWAVCLLFFLKAHTRRKRPARPLPYRRRR